jgi:hypothetical protein
LRSKWDITAYADAEVTAALGQFASALQIARGDKDLDEYPNQHGDTVGYEHRTGGREWELNPPRTGLQPFPDLKSGRPTRDASLPRPTISVTCR